MCMCMSVHVCGGVNVGMEVCVWCLGVVQVSNVCRCECSPGRALSVDSGVVNVCGIIFYIYTKYIYTERKVCI